MASLKYEQIVDSIQARINSGELAPGAQLPSGRDLCEQFNVARGTVVKAMDELRAAGVIHSRQGSGFYVTTTPLARPAGGRAAGISRAEKGKPFRRLGTPTREEPPKHIAEALGLADGDQALRRSRLVMLEDGAPYSLVDAWFPRDVADLCPLLAGDAPITEGTTRYVLRCTGRGPREGADRTTVRLATAKEAEMLAVASPAAVAVDLHVAHDQAGKALVCEEGVTPGWLWEGITKYTMGDSI